MDATLKQMEFIRSIEKTLGIKFGGSSKGDASKFISENIEKYRITKSLQADAPPTNRQKTLLIEIEHYIGVEFQGRTKQEATEFIQKHMDRLRHEWMMDRLHEEAEFEASYGGDTYF